MPQQTANYLKSRFVTGATPTQQDYTDWLDSYVHKDDLASLNNATIDARITTYDSSLRARNINGDIDSLGDVLHFLAGYTDEQQLSTVLGSLGGAPSWSSVTGKPSTVNVTWDEQVVSLDSYAPASPASVSSVPTVSVASRGTGPLLQSATRFMVKDIYFSRVSFQTNDAALGAYYADRIRSVVFAITPKISLT